MKLEKLKFKSLADAKAKFSKVIESVKEGEVIITKNGVPRAVIMDYEKYVKIMDYIDQTRDLYLMDCGNPGKIREIELDFEGMEEV